MPDPRRKVFLSDQVVTFVRGQAPEPRRRLRAALRALEGGRGDVLPLEDGFEGYHRLRAGAFRIVFRYGTATGGAPAIYCVFAQRRAMVYVLLDDLLRRGLVDPDRS